MGKTSASNGENTMRENEILVSVIIPVYGVEAFIERCASSLMEQTLREAEFIFVDDASPDGSVRLLREVIARYPERKSRVRLIRHESNRGLPSARNSGMAVARGEYIFHCDSDDYADPGMLERLYRKAKEGDADIVWCDWYLSFERKERYMAQPAYDTPMEALKGLLSGTMKYNVWNKLVRRELYSGHRISFPDGHGMGEDMTMIRLFARAGRVAYLPEAFYHYVKLNGGAFSATRSERHFEDIRYNAGVVIDDLRQLFGERLREEIAFFQLSVKFPLLISDGRDGEYARWSAWYPEANHYILRNKKLSLRGRALQWLAWRHQFWLVRLYYHCVHRLVYGLIYR